MVKRKHSPGFSNAVADKSEPNGLPAADEPSRARELLARRAAAAAAATPSKTRSKTCVEARSESVAGDKETDDKEEKALLTGHAPRSCTRAHKRLQDEAVSSARRPSVQPGSAKLCVVPDPVKTRRPWELWSVEDKNTFFEALCEYGKDFESIQHYIAQKNRKKSPLPQLIKNKDQVRHFYYRTWHKISKYLDIADDVQKPTQELYGLINYGELRKKIGGGLDEKSGQKLNELVHSGGTSIRCKGKNFRVKTPLCRALKKLNLIADPRGEQVKLPSKITVELQPHTNKAWARVQSLAQNPRMRLVVSMQRRLASLIAFLEKKWNHPHLKQKQSLLVANSFPLSEPSETLRILPKENTAITPVSMQATSEMSNNVSLQKYRENVIDKTLLSCPVPYPRKLCKTKKLPLARAAEEEKCPEKQRDAPLGEGNVKMGNASETEGNGNDDKKSGDVEATLQQLLALGTNKQDASKELPSDSGVALSRAESISSSTLQRVEAGQVALPDSGSVQENVSVADQKEKGLITEQIKKIQRGWNQQETGALTIGQVFIMLGHPNKLVLEYMWESHDASEHSHPEEKGLLCTKKARAAASLLSKLIRMASVTTTDANRGKQNGILGCSLHATSVSVSNGTKQPRVAVAKSMPKMQKESTSAKVDFPKVPALSDGRQGVFRIPSAHFSPLQRIQASSKNISLPVQHKKFLTTEQLDKLLPLNRKMRGSTRKSVVIQRELPLLPKTTTCPSMMTLRIVPSASQLAGSFMPVIPAVAVTANTTDLNQLLHLSPTKGDPPSSGLFRVQTPSLTTTTMTCVPTHSSSASMANPATTDVSLPSLATSKESLEATVTPTLVPANKAETMTNAHRIGAKTLVESTVVASTFPSSCSTSDQPRQLVKSFTATSCARYAVPSSSPNMSTLLELSLPSCENIPSDGMDATLGTCEKLLDITLGNSSCQFLDATPPTSIDSSVQSPFKGGGSSSLDNAWLGGETEDLSLSSLLNHLESPMKHISLNEIAVTDHISRLSSDVDNQLQCMMNESSVDYIAKFADLAAQIAVGESSKKSATSL